MSNDRSIQRLCPAKLNLALSVGLPLPDGMHPIASWMALLRFGDALTLQVLPPGSASRFAIAFAPDAPAVAAVDWPLEFDLTYRAHALLEQRSGRRLPLALTLSKSIPAGAGLGGGSSNAAATFLGVNELFNLGLSIEELCLLSRTLGSDISFLIRGLAGTPSGLVEGVGERVEPLPLPAPLHVVLVFPPFGCPTGPVYKAFDQLHAQHVGPRPPAPQRIRSLARQNPFPADGPFNDLAEPAFLVRPQLRQIAGQLSEKLQRPIHVTGSGSTLFFLANDPSQALTLAQQVRTLSGLPAVATHTL